MKFKSSVKMGKRPFSAALVMMLLIAAGAVDHPRGGDAIVVGMTGGASARLMEGPVHEGRTRQVGVSPGVSLGETARLETERDGQVRVVLSPGAVLCVAPGTSLTFERLRHTARGLPRQEADLVRQIQLTVTRGKIMLHAGPSTPTLAIRVVTDAGVVDAGGGTFAVAQQADGGWVVFNEADTQTVVPDGGAGITLQDQAAAVLSRDASGRASVRILDEPTQDALRTFKVCNMFFAELEPFFMDPIRFDRAGLAQYIGGADAGIDFLGGSVVALDVSPSFRPQGVAIVQPPPPTPGEPGDAGRWGHRRIWDWYNQLGAVKGVNYVPRYAVNSVEMWMADTFDTDCIDQELGWAREAGYTAIRVPLQYAVWADDPDGFMDRVERFMDIARDNGLRVVPVLFDDFSPGGDKPNVGPQPDPEPGVHNAHWVPSPAWDAVVDPAAWQSLEAYVQAVVRAFRRDKTILFWDLYNQAGAGREREGSLPLMEQTFTWVRDLDPRQPLAVPAWTLFGSAMTARKLERSDLITFQSFATPKEVDALLTLLRRHDRPIICTDWLMRQNGNDFDSMLPLFAACRVGWFNRGLVRGRTQMWLQQEGVRSESDPDVWQQDVLNDDGEPYRREDVEAIQAFRFEEN